MANNFAREYLRQKNSKGPVSIKNVQDWIFSTDLVQSFEIWLKKYGETIESSNINPVTQALKETPKETPKETHYQSPQQVHYSPTPNYSSGRRSNNIRKIEKSVNPAPKPPTEQKKDWVEFIKRDL